MDTSVLHTDARTTRAAVEAAIRVELDALGDRLANHREAAAAELERLAAFRWLTELARIRSNEVAELAGVSRQTLVNLRDDDRGADHDWPIDLRVLLALGLEGPQTADALSGSIAQPPTRPHEVTEAIDRLAREQLIGVAGKATSGTTTPITYWRLTARGIEDLPRRLRHAAMPPSRAWTAYVTSSPAEASAIAEAGEDSLGAHGAMVIPAGTVHGMDLPEVAFRVEAPDPTAAQAAAVARFRELRDLAGMTERQSPIIVSALVPPRRGTAGSR
jgi:hypothetical protein